MAGDSRWQLNVSVALALEYEAVGKGEAAKLGLPETVIDDIVDALRLLDRQTAQFGKPIPHYRRVLKRRFANPGSNSGPLQGSGQHGPLLQ